MLSDVLRHLLQVQIPAFHRASPGVIVDSSIEVAAFFGIFTKRRNSVLEPRDCEINLS